MTATNSSTLDAVPYEGAAAERVRRLQAAARAIALAPLVLILLVIA